MVPRLCPFVLLRVALMMKVSMVYEWSETSTGKLKYLRKILSQNHCVCVCVCVCVGEGPIDPDSKLGCCGDNLIYGMTFGYSTMYMEIQFKPHRKHCIFPLE
jgi:hypothetical protein